MLYRSVGRKDLLRDEGLEISGFSPEFLDVSNPNKWMETEVALGIIERTFRALSLEGIAM